MRSILALVVAFGAIHATPAPIYQLRSPATGENVCLSATNAAIRLTMSPCRNLPQQRWNMTFSNRRWSLTSKSGSNSGYQWMVVRANARGLVRLETHRDGSLRCLEANREVAGDVVRLMPCHTAQGQLWVIDSQL